MRLSTINMYSIYLSISRFDMWNKRHRYYVKIVSSLRGCLYERRAGSVSELARLVGSRCLNNFLLFFLCVYMEKRAGSVSEISPEGRRDPG